MKWPLRRRNEVTTKTDFETPATGIKGATIRINADKGHYRQSIQTSEELEIHREYNRVYETTVAGAIIDSETDDLFAQGWALQGEDEDEVAKVREYLTIVNFVTEAKKLATESKVYGFGIAEVGAVGSRHALVAHSSYNILPVMDEDGWLDGFVQVGTQGRTLAEFTVAEVVCLALRPNAATPGTGRSEIAQAYEAIVDYENIRKANTEMVLRMGYPTYDIEFSGEDGIVPANVMEGEVADLGPGSILATGLGGKINTLNAQGVTQVATYAETALQAVAVAMQVPRSMAGLADNSEATAKVTTAKYYNRVAAEQGILAQTMQARYLDRYVLPDLGIKPGNVQLFFNNPDPDAQLKKAQLLQILTALDPTDPEFLLSAEEMAEIWGKHPRAGEYDENALLDRIKDGIMHHIAGITGEDTGGIQ